MSVGPLDVALATNNGDIGGGEVMLLRIAAALRANGARVTVVAPSEPAAVAEASRQLGYSTEILHARSRKEWIRELRRWDSRERRGLLWCNGLVPAVATAGHPRRIVHLHQRPVGVQRMLSRLARCGAAAVVVPSESMRTQVSGATVMPNWTDPLEVSNRMRSAGEPFVVGFLGRISTDKGIDILAQAMQMLEARQPGQFKLAIGGEPRFVSEKSRLAAESALAEVSSMTDHRGWVDPAAFFDSIDLLAVPSVEAESFGLVAAEAMAAKVPVIVSDAGALPEVVGDEHPLIVPTGDVFALADAIESTSHEERHAHVVAPHERWRTHFSPEVGARRVQELIVNVAADL